MIDLVRRWWCGLRYGHARVLVMGCCVWCGKNLRPHKDYAHL